MYHSNHISYNLIILFISAFAFCNLILLTKADSAHQTDKIEIFTRPKRQSDLFKSFQHPAINPPPLVPKQVFAGSSCSYKALTGTCVADAHYRSFDGSCNNLMNPWWGTPNIPYERLASPSYADGVFLPRNQSVTGQPLPTPREVSNICSNEVGVNSERSVNSFFTSFGQFVDHDITNAATGRDDQNNQVVCQCRETSPNPFCLNIPTPDIPDQLCMLIPRSSAPFQREPACQLTVREQVNQVNSYLDVSVVYGNNKARADELRTFSKGQLKTTGNTLPPQAITGNELNLCRSAQSGRGCFFCGDSRSNENIGLTCIHTIFLRFHNKLALELSQINPHWTDDIIYQETRRILTAIFQHIVYDEFLPLVLGRSHASFGPYQYNPSTNPTITNEFATAAYRFGHSLVNGFLRRFNSQHQLIEEISLSQLLFRPFEAYNQQMGGLDTLIFGLLLTPASKFDSMVNDVLRNHLFEAETVNPQAQTKRFDLTAININRGRDHGLPTYNSMRQFCGLPRASSFADLQSTMDAATVQRLSSVYADVDDIDFYIGGVSERSVPDGVIGPTFGCVIGGQFHDLRSGDRFFYENQEASHRFTPDQLNEIRSMTMAHVLCQAVEGISEVQKNAFQVESSFGNQHVPCSSFPSINLLFWKE